MALLGVNIDHVATLREARKVDYPDPIIAAKISQDAGADQITCHLREDRRHIRDEDVPAILQAVSIPVNLEMAATPEMEAFAIKTKPHKVSLVPERREELTTEGGLDVLSNQEKMKSIVASLREAGIFVSMFIDPAEEQIKASFDVGAQSVELHTGNYCNTTGSEQERELKRLEGACIQAKEMKLFLAVGHGLNYQNILPIKKLPGIEEYNIGHSIVAHAVIVGLERAVREMIDLINHPKP